MASTALVSSSPTPLPANATDVGWYHCHSFPDGSTVMGLVDLRGLESQYTGGVDFKGKRVLEIGPAAGGLTFWMERQGAEVVIVDLNENAPWDAVKRADADWRSFAATRKAGVPSGRKAWWFAHRAYRSKAKAIYCGAYDVPDSLGRFDIVVVNAVLLHLERPFEALYQACRLCDDTVIVAEKYLPELEAIDLPIAKFAAASDNQVLDTHWHMNSRILRQMIEVSGFRIASQTRCVHDTHFGGKVYPYDNYVLVGKRP